VQVTVNTPTVAINTYGWLIRGLDGGYRPLHSPVLGSTVHPLEIRRLDRRTLLLTAEDGFLAPPGHPFPGEDSPPPVDVRNIYRMFDRIYRGSRPFTVGRRIELADLEVVIRQATADGRPEAVEFHFHRPLEDSLYHWVRSLGAVAGPCLYVLHPAGGGRERLLPRRDGSFCRFFILTNR
jgi:hypothetical protein